MYKRLCVLSLIIAIACAVASCSGGSGPRSESSNPTTTNANASLNKNDYPGFPDADAGADPAVPAEQGGKGFKGEGWETNTDYDLIGDPRAVKGGVLREATSTSDFPTTLRYMGPNAGTAWSAMIH